MMDAAYFDAAYFDPAYFGIAIPEMVAEEGGGGGGFLRSQNRTRSFDTDDELIVIHTHNIAIGVATWEA